MAKSIPGRPRGRGKIENFLGRLDDRIKELPGFIIDERDLDQIKAARTATNLLTVERFRQYLDIFVDQIRDEPPNKRTTRTRRELWKSSGSLPAPAIRRLVALVPEQDRRYVKLDQWGFEFQGEEYEPRVLNEDVLFRWYTAAQQPQERALCAVKLDTGWKVEVCLGDETWVECVPKAQQRLSAEERAELLARVRRWVQQRHDELLAISTQKIKSLGVDTLTKDLVTREPIFLEERQIHLLEDSSAATGSNLPSAEPVMAPQQGVEELSQATLTKRRRQRKATPQEEQRTSPKRATAETSSGSPQ